MVTFTWHARKYKVYKLYQKYILKMVNTYHLKLRWNFLEYIPYNQI